MNYKTTPRFLENIPPVTRNLLIINVLIWVLMAVCANGGSSMRQFCDTLLSLLGLHFWGSDKFNPIQLVTYMFIHSPQNVLHIVFNMFTLWMFGRLMEQVWGSHRFLIFYFVCGIGAALVQEVVWQLTWLPELADALAPSNGLTPAHMRQLLEEGMAQGNIDVMQGVTMWKNALTTIGASGAIYGILLGFAFVFPNMPLYLFFIPVPIKAKYMVIGYGVLEFFLGVSHSQGTVAHFAHLGGMLFGLILLLYWKKRGTLGGRLY